MKLTNVPILFDTMPFEIDDTKQFKIASNGKNSLIIRSCYLSVSANIQAQSKVKGKNGGCILASMDGLIKSIYPSMRLGQHTIKSKGNKKNNVLWFSRLQVLRNCVFFIYFLFYFVCVCGGGDKQH